MFNIEEEKILKQKFYNKRVNAAKENIEFNLTLDEFRTLVEEAGLIPSQLGYSGDNYVLARYNDQGDYSLHNCRFITQLENAHEKVLSEATRQHSRDVVKTVNEKIKNDPVYRAQHYEKIHCGIHNSEYYKQRKQQSLVKIAQRRDNLDQRYCGEKNSMFGTYWITNGSQNKKWKDEYGPIPESFYRGRVMSKTGT